MPALRSKFATLLLCILVSQSSAQTVKKKAKVETKVSHVSSVPVLNRVTFYGNVQDEMEHVQHWVVLYCVEWYNACELMRQTYLDLASSYERALNTNALLQLPVRFAEVDCQVDKVLCNEQHVDWYPEIVHYHRGDMVARWTADEKASIKEDEANMTAFLEVQMNFTAPETAEIDSVLGSNETEDIWNLPKSQQHPIKTAFRMAPLAAALVGMAVWVFTTGAEVIQGLGRLFTSSSALPASAADSPKKPPSQQMTKATHGLRHRLPESWARERKSIEL